MSDAFTKGVAWGRAAASSARRAPVTRAAEMRRPVSAPASGDDSPKTTPGSWASYIVDQEGRFDSEGNLKVYQLPSGDKGGKYEVAGINDRYHPEMAAKLASADPAARRALAERYIAKYTDAARGFTGLRPLEFMLRDSIFNHGLGGATKVLQSAVGVNADGVWGPRSKEALKKAEADPVGLYKSFLEKRIEYSSGRADPKFREGLNSRFRRTYERAVGMQQSGNFGEVS